METKKTKLIAETFAGRKVTLYTTLIDGAYHPELVVKETFHYDARDHYTSPSDVVRMLNQCFNHNRLAEEVVYEICFDAAGHIVGVFELTKGTVNTSLVGAREVFQKALLCGASTIILAHNHPSGDVTPSREDDITCAKIAYIGEMMGLKLVDFIINSTEGYMTYCEHGRIQSVKDAYHEDCAGIRN